MRLVATKAHRPDQLLDELNAVPSLGPLGGGARTSLLSHGDRIQVEFPDGVATGVVQAVIDAHVPQPPPPSPSYGGDGTPRDQLADAVAQLRQYLGVATPTQTQLQSALRLLIRLVLYLAQRVIQ
jgi:hypothetical protein